MEYRGEHRENCATLIDDFCEAELGLLNLDESIERVHRIGALSDQREHPRPIVVKFSSYMMREKVREQIPKQGTRNRIPEQFPKKIQEKRKKLYSILKEARRNREWRHGSKTYAGFILKA